VLWEEWGGYMRRWKRTNRGNRRSEKKKERKEKHRGGRKRTKGFFCWQGQFFL